MLHVYKQIIKIVTLHVISAGVALTVCGAGLSVDYQWDTNLTNKDLVHIVSWAKQARLRRLYELKRLEATLARTKDTEFIKALNLQIKLLRAEIYDLETKYIKVISVDTPEIMGRLPQ